MLTFDAPTNKPTTTFGVAAALRDAARQNTMRAASEPNNDPTLLRFTAKTTIGSIASTKDPFFCQPLIRISR